MHKDDGKRVTGSDLGKQLLAVLGIDCDKVPVESIAIKCRGGAHMAVVEVGFLVRTQTARQFRRVLKRYAVVPK